MPAWRTPPPRLHGTGLAAATALVMIAYQVGAKATRDALFLSSFPASALPAMTIGSAILSIAMAFAAARALSRYGPGRVIPPGFAGSALLLLGEWALVGPWPRGAAIVVYLHYGALGALLVSGFWAFLNERFDPRSAKRAIGRIGAGGTVGGLLGGFLAERIGSVSSVATMLPVLAGLHAACAWLVWRLGRAVPAEPHGPPPASDSASRAGSGAAARSGLRVLAGSPYLRTIVALVLLVTMSESLIDWVFKARAASSMVRGQQLLRLFAVFYTAVSLLTVVVQGVLSRPFLERFGLARSVATLPAAVGLGSVAAAIWPGLASAMGLRATESVVSNSLYRAGYESLFSPLSAADKRSVKAIVDVGAARSGDFLGAGLVQAALFGAGLDRAPLAVLLVAALLCAAAALVALRLHSGYVRALERGLVSRADRLDPGGGRDSMAGSLVLQSLGGAFPTWDPVRSSLEGALGPRGIAAKEPPGVAAGGGGGAAPEAATGPASRDPIAERLAALASGRPEEVRRALADGPIAPAHVSRAISLLAWNEVARDAIAALRAVGLEAIDELAGALTSRESDFAIRRRVPLVLGTVPDARAVEALLRGLADRRFEVRYRCGRALGHLLEHNPRLGVPPDEVFAAVLREVKTERRVWDGQRILDQWDDDMWSPVADDALRARASRSLEHVFTLLALALPRQPIRIAYRGLLTTDPMLRGTALEYLEWSLPAEIRKELWPYIEDDPKRPRETRSPDEALADLVRSNESIQIRLDAIRRAAGAGPAGEAGGAGGAGGAASVADGA